MPTTDRSVRSSGAAGRSILIAGPTASGKSALALALAERLGGTVINADSMQVYRELSILTARPTGAETSRAPHRLYGHVAAREAYSAGRFVREAGAAIAEAHQQGRVAIVVGGTGLYLKALTEGLSPIPPIPEPVRGYWRERAQALGADDLYRELCSRDPTMARRLASGDVQRITRALEVLEATGRSLAAWQAIPAAPAPGVERARRLVVHCERGELSRRIDERFQRMMAAGALDEVRALLALALPPALPAMRALGVAPLARHLTGQIGLEEAVARGQAESRQYAKRQFTWLRRNMITWNAIDAQEIERTTAAILSFIDF